MTKAAPIAIAAFLAAKAVLMPQAAEAQGVDLPASCKGMLYMLDGRLCPALNNYMTSQAGGEDPAKRHSVARPVDVGYLGAEPANTVIIDQKNDFLYLILGNGRARKYVIAQGQVGLIMPARPYTVFNVRSNPTWRPTASILARYPDLEDRTYEGGAHNPLGVRAVYLAFGEVSQADIQGRRFEDSLFRIHGTNQPSKLAKPDGQRKVSSGCIRMHNEDITDFAKRVGTGFRVIVSPEGLGEDLIRKLSDATPATGQRFVMAG